MERRTRSRWWHEQPMRAILPATRKPTAAAETYPRCLVNCRPGCSGPNLRRAGTQVRWPTSSCVYRPKGTQRWVSGPLWLSARTTTVPAWMNGRTYELSVFARSTDGTTSRRQVSPRSPLAGRTGPAERVRRPSERCQWVKPKVVTKAHRVTNAWQPVATQVRCVLVCTARTGW